MTLPVSAPFASFFDRSGNPLEDGLVYIGSAAQNPQTNPISVYWDSALTIPAAQPIRVSGGYLYRNGTPANVYVAENCSVTVRDRSGSLVYTIPTFVTLSAPGGSGEIGFIQAGAGAVARTVQSKLREIVSLTDFGAVGDGVTADTTDVQEAFDSGATEVYVPNGDFLCGPLTIDAALRLHGPGTITANSDADNLITVSAAGTVIDGIGLTGTGNFSANTATAVDDRVCLVKSTAANVSVRNCTLTNAYQIFAHFYTVDGCIAENNRLYGGITTFADTGYQGIRFSGCTNFQALGNRVIPNGTGKCQEAIILGTESSTNCDGGVVNGNIVEGAHDHGIYVLGGKNIVINGNRLKSDGAGIVYASANGWDGAAWNDYAGASITGNTLIKDGGSQQTGISLRDVNNTVCCGNTVTGFPIGITMQPNEYDSANNRMNNNTIANNVISGITTTGILFGLNGKSLGQTMNNRVTGNQITGTSASTSETGIAWTLGTTDARHNAVEGNSLKDIGGDGITAQGQEWMSICRNILRNVGTHSTGNHGINVTTCDQLAVNDNQIYLTGKHGILLTTVTNYQCNGNRIIDAGTTTNATYSGIKLNNADFADVMNNWIESQSATGNKIVSGIHGTNNSTGIRCWNNTVLRSTASLATQQFAQYTSNDLRGNKISTEPLIGTFTMDADASTTVNNANVQVGVGVTSRVILIPTNAAAATLVGSTESPVVLSAGLVLATSFAVTTADGGAAAGTETFVYELVQ